MGFLPVSRRLHISVSALPEREIKPGELSMLLVYSTQCILIELVTLLMALLNTMESVQGAQMLRKYLGFI